LSVSFGGKVLPTKIELIRIRRSLNVSRVVHKILEDKRDVLLRRMDEMIEAAGKAREEIWAPLSKAYRSLLDAYLRMGSMKLEATAATAPQTIKGNVNVTRVVDVDVPKILLEASEVGLTYGFADTSYALDETTKLMRQVIPFVCRAAEMENAIFRLASELQKTQRLINALEYLIIPQYIDAIRYITSTLEEREREEFVRLKHVKAAMEKKKLQQVVTT
jgi:V/A-type H+-transporting ATPase subunit D